MNYRIILFYMYTNISNPELLKEEVQNMCQKHNLQGRVIIAQEGINATLEGTASDINLFCLFLKSKKEFESIDIKESDGNGRAFPRLQVRVRDEIVNTKFGKHINPQEKTGEHITPEQLHKMYEKGEDFIVIDMRNEYEYKVGHFKNSVHPELQASRELVEKIDMLKKYKEQKVVTVCTGGVRCEKMSSYLLKSGFKNVSQLEGGIHQYMETYTQGYFKGALYTFDNRVVMDWTKEREIIGTCVACGEKTEVYSHCANAACHAHLLVCETCLEGEYIFCTKECKQTAVRISSREALKEHLYHTQSSTE